MSEEKRNSAMSRLPPHLTVPASASSQRQQFAAAYSVLEQAISEQAFPGAAFSVFARN
jgi:hypothetical protein